MRTSTATLVASQPASLRAHNLGQPTSLNRFLPTCCKAHNTVKIIEVWIAILELPHARRA